MSGLVHSGASASVPAEPDGGPVAPSQITAEEALRLLHVHHAGPALLDALEGLVAIIKAAGVYQLSRGVELGSVSWSVKCSDRLAAADSAIAKAKCGVAA